MGAFILVFLSLYGGLNYYIGLRAWQGIGRTIPMLNSKVYWVLFWITSLSFILNRFIGKFLPEFLSKPFETIGLYWMAVMLYLVLLITFIDLIRFLNKRIKFLPERFTSHEKAMLIISVVVLVCIATLLMYGAWSARSPKISTYSIRVDKQNGGLDKLKVVMVSDTHLGNIVDNVRLSVMVDKINQLEPDIILIPGDIIDDSLDPFLEQNMSENFRKLKSKYGVFASLGNHDGRLEAAAETVQTLEESGVRVLRDSVELIDDKFYVIGRDDGAVHRGSGAKRNDLDAILKDVDKSKPILLMDHQPRELEIAQKEGVDLQVSGHTHRGQLFPLNFFTSRIFEIDYGHLKKENLNTIVSSGFGSWGPPIRVGSRSEIVEILIDFK